MSEEFHRKDNSIQKNSRQTAPIHQNRNERSRPRRGDRTCARCRSLDFPRIFEGRKKGTCDIISWKATAHPIGVIQKSTSYSPCSLCRLFATLSPQKHKATQQICVLKAFSSIQHHFKYTHRTKEIQDSTILSLAPLGAVRWKPSHERELGIIYLAKKDGLYQQSISGNKIDPLHVNYEAAKYWIEYCRANHKGYCKYQSSAFSCTVPGFRLIDCETRQVALQTREVEYVALSYVWGSGSHASTRSLPNPASRVIEDAMFATKKLGFRYLWVDRYCISQLDTLESRSQIANMDQIYADAVFTIAAIAGDGPDYGLPGVSQRHRHVQASATIGDFQLVTSLRSPKEIVIASKWASRGWTFQEAKLSRRTLFFTNEQLVFECACMTCEESINLPLSAINTRPHRATGGELSNTRIFPPNGPGTSLINILDSITEYTSRNLTNESDNLNAILGIFNAFGNCRSKQWTSSKEPTSNITFQQKYVRMHHLWGLPILPRAALGKLRQSSMDVSLCSVLAWRSETSSARSHKFPSWSWAGWKLPKKTHLRHDSQDGISNFFFSMMNPYPHPIQPVRFWLDLDAGGKIPLEGVEQRSDFSEILGKASKILIVQGHIRMFRFRLTKDKRFPLEPIPSSGERIKFWPDVRMNSDDLQMFAERKWEALNISWSVECIYWLVLKRVETTYERVGIIGGEVFAFKKGVVPRSIQSFEEGEILKLQ
jgi:hypothetical protein